MLHKSFISNIEIYSDQWNKLRLGRLTSSKISALMGEKPFQTGAMSYIHQKAGESVTGQTLAEDEGPIEDENTVWGLQTEPEAINLFGKSRGLRYLVVQKLIFDPAGKSSSTPDALWIIDSSVIKEDCYNVATVEVKCPRKYHRFFPLYACDTPAKLKKSYSSYYWQVLDQMLSCNSSLGYFCCYHPLFPPGKNFRTIEFRKIDLWEDFKLLQQRKESAIVKLNELILEFKK